MDTLRRLLGASTAKSPPPRVETDEIFPLHMLDDSKVLRGIIVTWTLRFNDVLDAEKLHRSLSRLLEIGDWAKVGGRLRLNGNGGLEIHVPRPFTAERPAVYYTHRALEMDIEHHPLAKTLPKATQDSSVQAGPMNFREFAAREDAPETLDDLIYHDVPQLSLHITSFQDATLVALSWPHVLMDVMGQQALLQAWSLVLAGRDSEVPPVLGAREDAVFAAADADDTKKEDMDMKQRQLKGWSMAMFGLRYAWDMMWHPIEARTAFLPKHAVAELRRQAESDMASEDGDENKPFVSDGDVLTAWATRSVASSLPQPRPVTILHALNARFRLPSLLEPQGVYVQNMALAAFTLLSAEVATGSLGGMALENRRHLLQQATEGQVLACLREMRHLSKTQGDSTILCGESDALLMPFTNWTRAKVFTAADFSPAVIRAGAAEASRINPLGTMVYHHAQSMGSSATARNVVVVLGKDHGGNYWLTGFLSPLAWNKIQKDMKSMASTL